MDKNKKDAMHISRHIMDSILQDDYLIHKNASSMINALIIVISHYLRISENQSQDVQTILNHLYEILEIDVSQINKE